MLARVLPIYLLYEMFNWMLGGEGAPPCLQVYVFIFSSPRWEERRWTKSLTTGLNRGS